MNLKQTALLVASLLPLGAIAQTSRPPMPTPPAFGGTIAKPPAVEMPDKAKLSYAIGMYFGTGITNNISRAELVVDTATVLAAIQDVVNGKPTHMTDAEVRAVLTQFKQAMQSKKFAQAEEAKAKGDEFLAKFAKSPGVITLPDGLEYKVIQDGTGAMPKETDSVSVSYRGTLIDGTEFDRRDNSPTPMKGRIIQGWQKILPLMKVGSKFQVVIPSALGYGQNGYPPKIPGNSVLVFDMELKSIMPGMPTLPPLAPPSSTARPMPGSTTPVVSGQIIKVPSAEELKKGAKIEVLDSSQTNAASAK